MKKTKAHKHHFKKGESLAEEELELSEEQWKPFIEKGSFAARVVEVHKRYVFVSPEKLGGKIETNDVWLGSVARKYLQMDRTERNFLAVGDRVLCMPEPRDEEQDKKIAIAKDELEEEAEEKLPHCLVQFRAKRSSQIARLDPMGAHRKHVLAANLTQLLIVSSFVAPKVKWGLIDRYIVLAEEQDLKPVLVFNKLDLLKTSKPSVQEECKEMLEIYRGLGYKVLSIQADKPGTKIRSELEAIFSAQISLLSGHSGVGKSSIINLMKPEIEQDVETESILTKGRHTTSYASLIRLGRSGGFVIDTPGIRSFLIEEKTPFDLSSCFVEIAPHAAQCKFGECTHQTEPHCAVQEAVKKGLISPQRYKSFLAILFGAESREGRAGLNTRRPDEDSE
ncbi:MAG: ribosome small subunit-dependent GTPase A [Oligoflexales bacterium]|nr:ribosome small subunit-dependent GTPase A [Oligoflexales bacterium]